MNKIQNEYEKSKKYKFEFLENTKYVKINVENVAMVEFIIRNDSSYIKESLVIAPEKSDRKGAYGGSVKYHVGDLKKIVNGEKDVNEKEWKQLIRRIVVAVDNANSTHLNSDSVGIEQITDRICRIDRHKLVEMVKYPQKDDYQLIKIITEKTVVPQDDKNTTQEQTILLQQNFAEHFV